jgi:methylated-DNA-[protein]-cysteine S-methyltransferase
MMNITYHITVPSPVDDLLLLSDGQALTGLYLGPERHGRRIEPGWRRDFGPFREVERQLQRYFAGEGTKFDVPLALQGTAFQRRVWAELCTIGFGERLSYGELARRIGRPRACRPVGLANGRNPVSIIVPCHRVIGASGTLTGYGGGLARKQWLLEHEEWVALAGGEGRTTVPSTGRFLLAL